MGGNLPEPSFFIAEDSDRLLNSSQKERRPSLRNHFAGRRSFSKRYLERLKWKTNL